MQPVKAAPSQMQSRKKITCSNRRLENQKAHKMPVKARSYFPSLANCTGSLGAMYAKDHLRHERSRS